MSGTASPLPPPPRRRRVHPAVVIGMAGVIAAVAMTAPPAEPPPADERARDRLAPAVRLDHLPIAVADLDAAVRHWNSGLGFSIKPGRLHPNTIDNAHIRFADGSALELITAARPADDLASFYVALIRGGGGAAPLALEPADFDEVLAAVARTRLPYSVASGPYYRWLTFPPDAPNAWLFLSETTSRPPDLPEHTEHANGALRLAAVWVEGEPTAQEAALFDALGITPAAGQLTLASGNRAQRWRLADGELYRANSAGGARVTGVTIEVVSLDGTAGAIRPGQSRYSTGTDDRGRFIRIRPADADGIHLEFLEPTHR